MTAARDVHLITEPVAELQHFRAKAAFAEIWDKAMAVKDGIEWDEPKLPRQSRAPGRLQESEPHVFGTAQDLFRCRYFKILDLAIQCLARRISNKAVSVLT